MGTKESLNIILDQVPSIGSNINYWVVRTESGSYYLDYSLGGYVAINYNKISVKSIEEAYRVGSNEQLKQRVGELHPEVGNTGLAANQLITFCNVIAKGDVIIIPSSSSFKLNIGFVQNNILYDRKTLSPNDGCPYTKRRKVKWIKEIYRGGAKAISSHLAIYNVNHHKDYINRSLYDWYKIGEQYHYVIKVKSLDPIYYKELTGFSSALIEVVEEFENDTEIQSSVESLQSKIELSSPGHLILIGAGIAGLLFVALINALCKSKTKISFKLWGAELTKESDTEGLLNAISTFIAARKNDKLKKRAFDVIEKFAEKHDVQEPKEYIETLEKLGLLPPSTEPTEPTLAEKVLVKPKEIEPPQKSGKNE